MQLWNNIKNFMSVDGDDFEDEELNNTEPEKEEPEYEAPKKREPRQASFEKRTNQGKTISYNPQQQLQVVLVKPTQFGDVTAIADHINAKKGVILNLENANRELSRRIIDFLSGVTYANSGDFRQVANSTYMISPTNVDVMGELIIEDLDSQPYFN